MIAVALAVAGLATAGNAESQEQPQPPASDAAEGDRSSPGADDAPDPSVEGSQLGPLEAINAQATQTGSLPAPKELSCTASGDSINLSWQAVEGADDYQVLLSGITWAVATSTAHQLDGLPRNTRFEIGVQAGGDDGWGTPATKTCATGTGGGISGASAHDIPTPSGLPTCSAATSSSINVSWNAVADSAVTGYKVTASLPVSPRSGTLAATKSVSGRTTTSATLTGLNPFTSYIIAVRAVKGSREGVGTGRPCSTKPVPPVCAPSPATATVSWAKNAQQSSITAHQWYAAIVTGRNSYTNGRSVSGTAKSTVYTGLDPGRYTFRLWWRASQNGTWFRVGDSNPCDVPPEEIPDPPTGLTCKAITTTTITLEWDQPDGATKYDAGITPSNAAWVETTNRSLQFTGLSQNTRYVLHVRAGNDAGWSSPTNKACRTSLDDPPPPTGLECTAATTTTITATWNAVDPSYSVDVYRASNDDGDTWSKDLTATTHQFEGLTYNTEYQITARAHNATGWGTAAEAVECRTKLPPPPPPTGLECTAATTTTITASWDAVDPSYSVDVYQASNDNGADSRWSENIEETTHDFEDLTPNTAYQITARAHNATGWGAAAEAVECRTDTAGPSPATCGAVTATSVTLEWELAEGVHMWLAARNTAEDRYTDGRKLDASATSTVFTGLAPDTSYTFFFFWRPSEGAKWVKVLPSPVCSTDSLPAPTGLGCEASDTAIVLSWDEVAGATAYQVSMTDYPPFTPEGALSHKFTGLTADTSYSFRARAGVAADGSTVWGGEASETCSTLAAPLGAPTDLACTTSLAGASLSWTEVAEATKYQVSSDSGTTWVAADGLSSHTVSGLDPAAAHKVQVQAGNAAAWGGTASVQCPVVVLPAPEELMCATTLSSITLTWESIDGVQVYIAELKSSSAPDAQVLQTKTATAQSATFTGLTAGGTYYVSARGSHAGLAAGTAGIWCFANAAPPECSALGSDFVVVSWQADDMVHQWRTALAVGAHSFSNLVELASDVLSARFEGLSSETDYTFHLWWRSSAHSPWIQIYPPATCTTTEPPPPAPIGFTCITPTSSTITAQWSLVEGADGYRVSSDKGTTWIELDETATSHIFSGLTASSQYEMTVQAHNAGGWGASAQTTCSTTEPPLPAPIGAVCSAAINSLELRWNPVDGASRYRVSKDSKQTWEETTGTALTLTGLAADNSYDSIRVQTGDANSWDGATSVSCRTLPSTALAAPGGLVCTASADSITLKWTPVSSATRYRAGYGHTWTTAPVTARQHTFDSLDADTSYELRVQAGDADGWESVAAVKSCTTSAAPLQAPALRCIAATTTSITWGWTPVPGATGYQHRTSSSQRWQTTTVPDLASPTINFTATAIPGLRHQLRVRATKTGENGPEAVHDCFSAPSGGGPARPEIPLPACTSATTTSITVEWDPAYGATGYKVGHQGNSYALQDHQKAELSVTVTGLSPNQSTLVLVRSTNTAGSKLGQVTCHTLAEPPQNLAIACTANNEGPPTIAITWSATLGANSYQMALTRDETTQSGAPQTAIIAHYTGNQANVIADGDQNTSYHALARVRTTGGWSDWTPTATGRCPAPAPV